MRTTVTLDADVEAMLKRVMRERGVSFKEALNSAVRDSLARGKRAPAKPFRTPSLDIRFHPDVKLDKALQLAGELEDEEILRKMLLSK
jgi:hypothetical protein